MLGLEEAGVRRRLGLLKRVEERFRADARFRELFEDDPAGGAALVGLDADPRALRALVRGEEDPSSADLALYRRLQAELESGAARAPAPDDERFRAWRDAPIARCDLQLSRARNSSLHGPIVAELSVGCSVGCWFCAAGAEKLSSHFRYSGDGARVWRETLEVAEGVLGRAAAGAVFCYWATDPLDNPDYERFCAEVVAVLGIHPPTTTALALKDVERTKRLLAESERQGVLGNRFSILTLGMLDRVHRAFTPEELLFVTLVLQNPEAEALKSVAGGFLDAARRDPSVLERELAKLRDVAAEGADVDGIGLPQSSACVTGFHLNMVRRSVQLISPCPATERWPLGHYVYEEATFESAADLERVLRSMIGRHMTTEAPRQAPARLAEGLDLEPLPDGFRVKSRTEEVDFESAEIAPFLRALGEELRSGERTPDGLGEWGAERFRVDAEDVLDAVDAVWSAGAHDMEPGRARAETGS